MTSSLRLFLPLLLSINAAGAAGLPVEEAGPAFEWLNKRVLWLGTSIPHQGYGQDGYPEQFCALMGCTVTNHAFSGSRMTWFESGVDESCKAGRNAPKGLSATDRELQEKMKAALPDDGTSSYHDSCSRSTRPMRMGHEYRINRPWKFSPFDVVMIDHGHNDRRASVGELDPPAIPIAGVKKGVKTEIILRGDHGLKKNDDITIRTPGIPRMDFWTGEIASIEGEKIIIRPDSSHFAGEYTGGGTAVKYDKSKVYDAYNLVISNIYHMNALHGGNGVLIILMAPPSEWTGGRNDGSIAAISKVIARVAHKWSLPFYNMNADLKIDAHNLLELLPDGVHPTTAKSRAVIAQHIAAWARRGMVSTGRAHAQQP